MWANTLARSMNALNPTGRGRKWLARQAERFGTPPAETYRTINSLRMHLDPSDAMERLIYYHAFEREELNAVRTRLNPGDLAVDLGANVGIFTLLMRAAVGASGKVIAVEPNPKVRARLEQNLALNVTLDGDLGVTVLPIAVSDEVGELELHVPIGGGNHGVASLRLQESEDVERVRVNVQRGDDALAPLVGQGSARRRVAFIKIDIEGAELGALKGLSDTIRRDRPRMMIELNYLATRPFGYAAGEIARFVCSLHGDYRLSRVGPHRVESVDLATLDRDRPFGTDVVNVLFD